MHGGESLQANECHLILFFHCFSQTFGLISFIHRRTVSVAAVLIYNKNGMCYKLGPPHLTTERDSGKSASRKAYPFHISFFFQNPSGLLLTFLLNTSHSVQCSPGAKCSIVSLLHNRII